MVRDTLIDVRGSCALLLLLAGGCNSILGVKDITLGDAGSGSGDASVKCIPGSLFSPCFTTLPTKPVTVVGGVNTDDPTMCAVSSQLGGGPEVCVIGGSTVTVQNVRATGSRPLVIAAVTDLTVSGMLDIMGGFTTQAAGANTGSCIGPGPGGDSATSPGGGGGGGFGATGEKGGAGSTTAVNPGNAGGIGTAPTLMFVRGGCDGAKGGDNTATTALGGLGGTAAGAVYLVAGNSIDVTSTGTIAAAGGGGKGGAGTGGGGGGGASGGLVGLDAPTVSVEGTIYANGGGGGGGGGTQVKGGAGQDGSVNNAGPGLAGTPNGGGGGTGGVGATPASAGNSGACTDQCAGGGGGGSIGIVWMATAQGIITGTIVPDSIGP